MPVALSSTASARANRSARRASPLRPSAAMGGHSVKGALRRATRPPSAPTRIDLAGGTIDIWPLYLAHDGASTVNAAISLRAHATIEPRTDGHVGLQSIDTHQDVGAAGWQDLDPRGKLPLLALLARHY